MDVRQGMEVIGAPPAIVEWGAFFGSDWGRMWQEASPETMLEVARMSGIDDRRITLATAVCIASSLRLAPEAPTRELLKAAVSFGRGVGSYQDLQSIRRQLRWATAPVVTTNVVLLHLRMAVNNLANLEWMMACICGLYAERTVSSEAPRHRYHSYINKLITSDDVRKAAEEQQE